MKKLIYFILVTSLLTACVGSNQTSTPTATFTPVNTATPTATFTPVNTATPKVTATPELGIGSTWERPADGMVMVYVPAGSFEMGTTLYTDELPAHMVTLDAFWIDRTEVTNKMYAKCVEAGACKPPAKTVSWLRSSYYGNLEYDEYPVILVTWYYAVAYCEWVGGRLPTEAEWEFAARGEDGRAYPWGDELPNSNLLNYRMYIDDTTAVGSYPDGASPYGALDMAGNVWEWVADWWGLYRSSSVDNPIGPSSGAARVIRGGSWGVIEKNVRSSARSGMEPVTAHFGIGFRCSSPAVIIVNKPGLEGGG